MTQMALKWAISKPATNPYPFAPRVIIPGSRGLLTFNKDTCVYCSVCRKKCPTGAIGVNRHQKKWAIDRLRCISCGYCVEACPKDSLALSTSHGSPAVTKDREIYQGEMPAPKAPAAAPAPVPAG
ncbi:MAG: 4Fe-4S binding protein [Opitutae bacterium]|nr:4Fe-4S binding protein [Opitutae bacterium]